jgi:hypothetical protein
MLLGPFAVQSDDLGLCKAGVAGDVAYYAEEVELPHNVLDGASDEVMGGRAFDEVVMHSACPRPNALNGEVSTILRRELKVGVGCLDRP